MVVWFNQGVDDVITNTVREMGMVSGYWKVRNISVGKGQFIRWIIG
jgi:hypothetical protein